MPVDEAGGAWVLVGPPDFAPGIYPAVTLRATLERTVHLRALCAGAKAIEFPRIVRADTGILLPDRGPS